MSEVGSTVNTKTWSDIRLCQGGRSLIEASAGTGKTWTIGVLYLRFILEQNFTPRQILVSTFTNAAADELRQRLRARLLWAESHAKSADNAESDKPHEDTLWLFERWQGKPESKIRDLQKLRVAIAELDIAPITTLHGVCQKILSDHPFETGTSFRPASLVSIDALAEQLAKDLLRRIYQGDAHSDEMAQLYLSSGLTLKKDGLQEKLMLLMSPSSHVSMKSDEQIRKQLPLSWADKLRRICEQERYFTKNCSLRKYWLNLAEIIENPYSTMPSRNTDKGLANAKALTGISATFKTDTLLVKAADFSAEVANSGIIEYLRGHLELKFWSAAADWARSQANSRLTSLNQRTYDDLLSTVFAALKKETELGRQRALADLLHEKWPAALIDEFQDTDAIQFGILDLIYRDTNNNQRGRLVIIGDPKQSIYRFRGGDIHTYLNASHSISLDDRISLGVNRRSSRAYVSALNEFYQVAGYALGANGGDGIQYSPVSASDSQDSMAYLIDGQECKQPLVFHHQTPAQESKSEHRQHALEECANHIAALLHSGRHSIAGLPIAASDIAVLVPGNAQLIELRDLLNERGIPSVTTSRDNVFSTDTAKDLLVILYSIANSSETGLLRAAIATTLWGLNYAALRELSYKPAKSQQLTNEFYALNDLWQQRGIQSVVNALIDKVAVHQLSLSDGERVLTDLRHLGELLQAQSEQMTGRAELLAWFLEQRDQKGGEQEASDARQLRIESDAKRVRLMTLHASKGLEFQIVYLPLMWSHEEGRGNGFYQTTDDNGLRQIELTNEAKQKQNLELQDERFRVLYVALTRAIHACHVFALQNDSVSTNKTSSSAIDIMLQRMRPELGAEALYIQTPHIEWINHWQPTQTRQNISPVEMQASVRHARSPKPMADMPLPAKHSFSTLTKNLHADYLRIEASADDEQDIGEQMPALASENSADYPMHDFPEDDAVVDFHPQLIELEVVKGVDFGNAIHAIFENRMPMSAFAEQNELIVRKLSEFNVRCMDGKNNNWLASKLSERLQSVLDTPLASKQGPGPRLGSLQADDILAEMEFYFAIDSASLSALRATCHAHQELHLVPANFQILSGLMTGKIDLIFRHDGRFHILDYKGNYLGNRVSDYQGAALNRIMDQSHYRFQALIYVLALDRYLRQRIPDYHRDKHLGDCFYIFIRAVGIADDAGIWRHRFSDALLDDAQLIFADSASVQDAA